MSGVGGAGQLHPVFGGGSVIFADNFNRPNNAGIGASWSSISNNGSGGSLSILSNQMRTNGMTFGFNALVDSSLLAGLSADQYVSWQAVNSPASQLVGGLLRAVDLSNCYLALYDGGSGNIQFHKRVAGTYTQIGTNGAMGTISAGQYYKFTAVGNVLSFYLLVAGVWTLKHSVTDGGSTYTLPGRTGLWGYTTLGGSTDNFYDDFETGNV